MANIKRVPRVIILRCENILKQGVSEVYYTDIDNVFECHLRNGREIVLVDIMAKSIIQTPPKSVILKVQVEQVPVFDKAITREDVPNEIVTKPKRVYRKKTKN